MLKRYLFIFTLLVVYADVWAARILIPMDEAQRNHLKAYGIAFWELKKEIDAIVLEKQAEKEAEKANHA